MFAADLIDTVPVGNAGNASDRHGAGYGAVDQNYRIGKYDLPKLCPIESQLDESLHA